jgi:hypothetical protein
MTQQRPGKYRPGKYGEITAWLAANSPATVNQVCTALGVTRSRALLVLRAAAENGDARKEWHDWPRRRYPLKWRSLPPAGK